MNNKNFWIACLGGAAMSLLLANLPLVNFINLFLCAGFWASAIFAVWVYRRLGGTVTLLEGVKIGALMGFIAWAIGFLMSLVGLAGIQGIMNGIGLFLPAGSQEGTQNIPVWSATLFNLLGVLFEVGFGVVGGLIGAVIFGAKKNISSLPSEAQGRTGG